MARAFGLYVHWPFCAAKCPYCDFNSHVAAQVDQDRWRRAYAQEIARLAARTGPRVLSTIFFGGGTPSLMDPAVVAGVIAAARAAWMPANDMEITLEANPTSVEAGRFAGYRDAGVNRVSLGVQALRDSDLQRLGRRHSAAEARAAVDLAQRLFPRVSFDLIYARQDQSLADWQAELTDAVAMAADHLSLYQLTVEPGTAFAERLARGGLAGLPSDDLAADMFEATQEICGAAGLAGYEVSNHARPGAESRHNLIYWESGDWAGVGPGAHGRLTLAGRRVATEAIRAPGAWLAAVEAATGAATGAERHVPLAPAEAGDEYLLMGLRTDRGIALSRLASLWTRPVEAARLEPLAEDGLLHLIGERVVATPRGRLVLNSLIAGVATALGAPAPDQSGT